MEGYLGETKLESHDGTPYEGYSPVEWALNYIEAYGQIDGAHHKLWVLDQVARILKGTSMCSRSACSRLRSIARPATSNSSMKR